MDMVIVLVGCRGLSNLLPVKMQEKSMLNRVVLEVAIATWKAGNCTLPETNSELSSPPEISNG